MIVKRADELVCADVIRTTYGTDTVHEIVGSREKVDMLRICLMSGLSIVRTIHTPIDVFRNIVENDNGVTDEPQRGVWQPTWDGYTRDRR